MRPSFFVFFIFFFFCSHIISRRPVKELRVVVRKGSIFSPHDLQQMGAASAASVIVLNPHLRRLREAAREHTADMPPIKALLALRRVPGALRRNHAVVELGDKRRIAVLERIGMC